MILEIISFLQIAIIHKKINTNDPYYLYFKYENIELLKLKKWCEKIQKIFELNLNARNPDHLLINEIISFDIVYMLDNVLSQENPDSE